MCHVKTGAEITHVHDVQNMITSYILRAKQPYTILSLSDRVIHSCAGCNIEISESQIKTMVRDTTIALLRSKYISNVSGSYCTIPLVSVRED